MAHFDSSGTYISGFSYATRPTITFTTPSNESYSLVSVGTNPAQAGQYDINKMQIEVGSNASPYMPYGTHNWYIEKNITKVVLNGSETGWHINNTGTANWYYEINNTSLIPTAKTQDSQLSNYYKNGQIYNGNTLTGIMVLAGNNNHTIRIRYGSEDTIANYQAWLSNNNVKVYYILENPTYEIITNDNLIEQLEAAQDMYLVDNLCYVYWEGNIPAVFTLQYPTTDTLNAYITTEDNKLIRTEWRFIGRRT